jgi:hypothetical protein
MPPEGGGGCSKGGNRRLEGILILEKLLLIDREGISVK